MQKNDENESVSATIDSLKVVLSEVQNGKTWNNDFPPIFMDERVLKRPPFTYIYALTKFFAQRKPSLGWTKLLFDRLAKTKTKSLGCDDDDDSDSSPKGPNANALEPCLSKKEKLTFLSRLLALVTQVTGRRFDVLVSPSKILCGQDVLATHAFLRSLASSTMAKEEDMAEAVKYVLKEGDGSLYKRGVRTRKGFTNLQAMVRGWHARRLHPLRSSRRKSETRIDKNPGNVSDMNEATNNDGCSGKKETITVDDPGNASEPDVSNSCQVLENDRTDKSSKTKSKSKAEEDSLLDSYQAVISRKSQVEDELKVAEARLNKENDKLIRILHLGTKHKTRINAVPYAGIPRPPLSAPSIGRNIITNNALTNESHNVDEAFRDKITNFSERQRSMKQKERRIDERDTKLKQRFAKSKQKEVELKLQEERISELAGKMRKQQHQLKEQKLQFERSKFIEPVTLPEETTRPCLLCTEKKMKMREVRNKVRQRTRELSQREADVIGRAHELRRREIQLAKREQALADLEERHSLVDDFLGDYFDDEPPREKHHRRRRRIEKHKDQPIKQTLPDLRVDSDPTRPKGARKRRRRRSPLEGRPSTPKDRVNDEQDSMRAHSFGESIPTIEEETPLEEQEDSIVEEVFKEADASEFPVNSADAVDEKKDSIASNNSVAPTDVQKARKQLGISKSKEREKRRSAIRKQQLGETLAGTEIETVRRVSQPPPPKQRHVFAFEKRESHIRSEQMLRSESKASPGRRMTSSTPTRERDNKPRASYEKHDDWISSFDVQMKCAMNRLKDLV